MSNQVNTPFSPNDVEIIQRDVVYQGVFRMVRLSLRHRHFDGGWSKTFMRELMERQSAAGILPYDPKLDQVILIEQFRPGALGRPNDGGPWLIEVVAGAYGRDETASEV